jgi:hypothetical protein
MVKKIPALFFIRDQLIKQAVWVPVDENIT